MGTRNPDGYGHVQVHGQSLGAHRVAWELEHGPIPSGMDVLHSCDTPPCCNTGRHHFLGTDADNAADRARKGRTATGDRNGTRRHPDRVARGEQVGNAKLTADLVRAIRADGRSQTAIARSYGIGQTTVSDIKRRRTWRHLTDSAAPPPAPLTATLAERVAVGAKR